MCTVIPCNSSIAFSGIWLVASRQPVCGKIMFSVMSVYHFVHRSLPCDHYPSCIGPDYAWTTRPQLRPLPSSGLFTGTPCRSYPSDMDMFKFLQLGHQCRGTSPHPPRTCSNLFTMKYVWFANGRFASFWNAFLLSLVKV